MWRKKDFIVVGIILVACFFIALGLVRFNEYITVNEVRIIDVERFDRQQAFVYDVSVLIEWVYNEGYELSLGEAWRPKETQAVYLEQGKTKTMHSKHQERLAIDFNLFIDGKYTDNPEDYRLLGEYWESLREGNVWGGRFGVEKENYDIEVGWDSGHFGGE